MVKNNKKCVNLYKGFLNTNTICVERLVNFFYPAVIAYFRAVLIASSDLLSSDKIYRKSRRKKGFLKSVFTTIII